MALSYGSDVLKAAIVTQLKDYDAYIDNELPDYILVMLANKKTVSQISQDLELFLGDNTQRFSQWLKGVLENPEVLASSSLPHQAKKRSVSERDADAGQQPARKESASPPRRKIVVHHRSVKAGDQETNKSTYKRTEIVRETTTCETTEHSSEQSEEVTTDMVSRESDDEDAVSSGTLSSVVRWANNRTAQPSGRILLRAIDAIHGNGSSGRHSSHSRMTKKQHPTQQAPVSPPDEDTHKLPPDDLRKRLGKKLTSSSALGSASATAVSSHDEQKLEEQTAAANQTSRMEGNGPPVIRPKFVVTMNTVGEQYKTPLEMGGTKVEPNNETTSSGTSKLSERCRFWPNCKNGEACSYYHPSIPCKLFPKCKFGDKCKFVHPVCKFNAGCMKPGCPYLHTAPRSKQLPSSSAAPMISSFPQTTRTYHHWNTGHQTGVRRKSNQFVWTAASSPSNTSGHISERAFAVDEKPKNMPVPANI